MAGLYIHVPFCTVKCAYCDFYSGPLRLFDAQAYAIALERELAARRGEVGDISTVYIGGGTPGTMPASLFAPFLTLGNGERTVEVNPENVTPGYAEALLRAGANRVSMGVQSLSDLELKAVGRRHNAAGAIEAFRTLRSAGFDNISLDLIYGLPGQTPESWRRSLCGVLELGPQHLSAYLLSYEPGTLLYSQLQNNRIEEASEESVCEMYATLCSETSKAGFEHYEISNFAREGMHSRHNSAYWDMTPYLGLGPAAHSFDGRVRRYNRADYKGYMAHPESWFEIEDETAEERHNDAVFTALRTARGLDPALLSPAELEVAKRTLQPTADGRLRIAEADWLRANTLILPLLRV